mmetsp:Transcript_78471/g.188153  ORF Transcript_78471/g.188153 Transcript_78471/m.188153 type:complete len:349 (-) Transcript_78471:513-1559(-)
MGPPRGLPRSAEVGPTTLAHVCQSINMLAHFVHSVLAKGQDVLGVLKLDNATQEHRAVAPQTSKVLQAHHEQDDVQQNVALLRQHHSMAHHLRQLGLRQSVAGCPIRPHETRHLFLLIRVHVVRMLRYSEEIGGPCGIVKLLLQVFEHFRGVELVAEVVKKAVGEVLVPEASPALELLHPPRNRIPDFARLVARLQLQLICAKYLLQEAGGATAQLHQVLHGIRGGRDESLLHFQKLPVLHITSQLLGHLRTEHHEQGEIISLIPARRVTQGRHAVHAEVPHVLDELRASNQRVLELWCGGGKVLQIPHCPTPPLLRHQHHREVHRELALRCPDAVLEAQHCVVDVLG